MKQTQAEHRTEGLNSRLYRRSKRLQILIIIFGNYYLFLSLSIENIYKINMNAIEIPVEEYQKMVQAINTLQSNEMLQKINVNNYLMEELCQSKQKQVINKP